VHKALANTTDSALSSPIVIDRTHLAIGLMLLFALLFVLERGVALRRPRRPLLGRLLINLSMSALTFAAAMLLVRPAVMTAMEWTPDTTVGVIHIAPMPGALQFILSFLLMDLTFYWWHVVTHRVPFLWRFHNVHHLDPDLDVSTAFRFHFGEIALSTVFRIMQVIAVGPSVPMFVAYELVFQANTLFHHSNVRLPIRIERLLNFVLVTPRMHGIHHSQVREETNSNYSVVFSWWDRLHRTVGLDIPQSDIVIGIPAYSDPADNGLWNSLLLPFRAQRDYWRRLDGTAVQRGRAGSSRRRFRLAE
jgi:sterol desaturase/sphingolipid hydroxylase (fatty acid hydroxylase superfamily)